MLEASDCDVILSEEGSADVVSSSEHFKGTILMLDKIDYEAADVDAAGIGVIKAENNWRGLVYVLFTSGSTGKPKGVMLEYEQLVNLLRSFTRLLDLPKKKCWLGVTTFTFDICELEVWGPLISGIKLVFATEEEQSSPLSLVSLMKVHKVDVMQATPATWALLISSNRWDCHIENILTGGEALPVPIAKVLATKK